MSRSVALIAGLAFMAATACGGLVVFVDDGAGIGGEAPGPGPEPGPSNSSSSTGTPDTLCDQYCTVWGQCSGNACEQICEQYLSGDCPEEAAAFHSCMANGTFNGCTNAGELCEEPYIAWIECLDAVADCVTQECGGTKAGSCDCVGACGASVLEQYCDAAGSDGTPPITCDCYLDGAYLGSCEAVEPCSIEAGCCLQFVGGIK